jgi:hypothetical protein
LEAAESLVVASAVDTEIAGASEGLEKQPSFARSTDSVVHLVLA